MWLFICCLNVQCFYLLDSCTVIYHKMKVMLALNLRNIILVFGLCLGVFVWASASCAQNKSNNDIFNASGRPLPRFASLAKNETNVRAGPGQKYPIKWVLKRKDLPVEIILEFDHWRKIKDHEGGEGWVFHSLLSGKRTAIILGSDPVYAYKKPFDTFGKKSRVSMYLDPKVIVELKECKDAWCKVLTSGYSGWVKRNLLWGVYESENID